MERVKRQHRLDAGIKGWIINTSKKNLWRVPSWYDLDDLIQDGYICYASCNLRYKAVKEQRHFMALVKVTFINHIHDLSKVRTRLPEEALPPEAMAFQGVVQSEAPFFTLVKQLPGELVALIEHLLSDKPKPAYKQFPDHTRETTNQYLCRLLGIDPNAVNLATVFREHFT